MKKINFYFIGFKCWINLDLIIIPIHKSQLMKVAIFAFLIIASFAASFDEVRAIVKNDQCAESSLEILRPQIEEQIKELKQVKI